MKVEMMTANEPASREEVDRLQTELGVTLPVEYVEFLLDQNGGMPRSNVFSFDRGNNASSVVFFGAYTGQDYNDVAASARRHEGRLPAEFVPIGDDPGGNLIVLAVSGSDAGSIWFWDHENESPDGTPTRANMYELAPSLSEFITSLTLDPDAEWA